MSDSRKAATRERPPRPRMMRLALAVLVLGLAGMVLWNATNLAWFLFSAADDDLRAAVGGEVRYRDPDGPLRAGVLREARIVFAHGRPQFMVWITGRQWRPDGAISSYRFKLVLDPWELARLEARPRDASE